MVEMDRMDPNKADNPIDALLARQNQGEQAIAHAAHDSVLLEALDKAISEYEWYTSARIIRRLVSGKEDPRLTLTLSSRASSPFEMQVVDGRRLVELSDDDIIDRFLSSGDYRIVAEEESADSAPDIAQAADNDPEGEYVSEELAKIYLDQGLYDQASTIYRQLSLHNPEKSVYFAEIIARIDKLKSNQ